MAVINMFNKLFKDIDNKPFIREVVVGVENGINQYRCRRILDGKVATFSDVDIVTGNVNFEGKKSSTKKQVATTIRKSCDGLNLLSLDVSSNRSGFCVFSDGNYVESGNFRTIGERNKRITDVAEKTKELIDKYNINQIVIEDIYLSKSERSGKDDKVNTFKILANLQGAIIYVCCKKKINVNFMTANEWRSHSGVKIGLRNQSKDDAIKKAYKEYGVSQEDEADSIFVGIGFLKKFYK